MFHTCNNKVDIAFCVFTLKAAVGKDTKVIPVCLPPVGIVLVDNVKDVPALEGDAELVTRDVQVVFGAVGEVGPVVVHGLGLILLIRTTDTKGLPP